MRLKDTYKNCSLKRHVKKFGSKNNGYFNYFVVNWSEYRGLVLWLVNNKNSLMRAWGRHKFRIDQDKEAAGRQLHNIHPNHYDVMNPDGSITSVFRTHNKYAKRLYYGFYLVWWTLHLLDWIIQRTYNPEFSFGFDTLTAYPDADPETTTVDGRVYAENRNLSFSSIRGLSTGDIAVSGSGDNIVVMLYSSATTNQYQRLDRGFTLFDSSSIGQYGVLLSASISLWLITSSTDLGSFSIHIASSNPASNTNLVTGDFSQVGNTSYGNIASGSFVADQYNDITLDTSCISLTSITKLSELISWDINNSAPSWNSGVFSRAIYYPADQTGTSSDPKLVVTYTTEVIEQIAGTAAGSSTAEMKLTAVKKMVMSAAGAAAAEMNLQVGNFLPLAVAQCAATAELTLKAEKKMALTSAGGSSASLKLSADKKMQMPTAGVCYAVAHVGVYIGLAGSSAGVATAEMNLLEANYMQMPSNGNSTAEMKLSVSRKLKGASAGNASAVSDLRLGTHVLTLENAE